MTTPTETQAHKDEEARKAHAAQVQKDEDAAKAKAGKTDGKKIVEPVVAPIPGTFEEKVAHARCAPTLEAATAYAATPEEAAALSQAYDDEMKARRNAPKKVVEELRSGTGATIPGMKSVAGDPPSAHPVVYATEVAVVGSDPRPAVKREVDPLAPADNLKTTDPLHPLSPSTGTVVKTK